MCLHIRTEKALNFELLIGFKETHLPLLMAFHLHSGLGRGRFASDLDYLKQSPLHQCQHYSA